MKKNKDKCNDGLDVTADKETTEEITTEKDMEKTESESDAPDNDSANEDSSSDGMPDAGVSDSDSGETKPEKAGFVDELKGMSKQNKSIAGIVVIVAILVALIICFNGCTGCTSDNDNSSEISKATENVDSKDDTLKAYSAKLTYKAGDYVIYKGKVYSNKTVITKAEKFDSTKWTEIKAYDKTATYKVNDLISITKDKTVTIYKCINSISTAEEFTAKNWNEIAKGTITTEAKASASSSADSETAASTEETASNTKNSATDDTNNGTSATNSNTTNSNNNSGNNSNNNSGNNNSSSSNKGCTVAHHATLTHIETVVDNAAQVAYDELVYAEKVVDNYWNSGMTFDSIQAWGDWTDINHDGEGTYTNMQAQTGTIHHDAVPAVTHTVTITDKEAYDSCDLLFVKILDFPRENTVPFGSQTGNGFGYCLNQEPYFCTFLDVYDVSLDNTAA
jgi:hypothetical protein